jgi:SAM-dependent methyltransferase
MIPGALPKDVADTAEAFGWQWQTFTEQLDAFRGELLEWLAPVTADAFRGKVVLDAGCGKGRHLLLSADFGAAQVVGLDLSAAVEVARRATEHLPSVDVVQGNLLSPPLGDGTFDLIYSIGVIHHVPDPSVAVRSLARCLKPGGTLHVWVYGYEGNTLVRWLVDPARRLLAKGVPRPLVRAGTLPIGAAVAGVARLSRRLGGLPIPYRDYLRPLADYSVSHIWTIVYDQLMAPTTHYVKRRELEAWFRAAGLKNIRIRNSRGMSWTATGEHP